MSKRAYISDDNKVIAGVCAGLADNFNTDSTVIRILFVLGTLVTGLWVGCLVYYLLTVMLPVHEDSTWQDYHASKKVKNGFLYSIIVLIVFLPVVVLALVFALLILGSIAA